MSNWFSEVLNEINQKYGRDLTGYSLIEQISAFAQYPETSEMLRNHYPKDLSKWENGGPLRGPSVDLFLTFMATKYPRVRGREVERLRQTLRYTYHPKDNARSGRGPLTENRSLELLTLLAKESKRRASNRRGGRSYWAQMQDRVTNKYSGYYVLLRTSSDEGVRAELLALKQNPHHPQIVTVYWGGLGEFWTGDLLVNPTKFSGTLTRRSTDSLLEPVSLNILRTATRPKTPTLPSQLVLSGLVVGWSDLRNDALICSSAALFQLNHTYNTAISQANFYTLMKSSRWREFVAELENQNWKYKSLFFKKFGTFKPTVYKQLASDTLKFPLTLDAPFGG